MNDIKIFENYQFGEIRVRKENNQIWFVAKDLCNALDISHYRDAVYRLDDDERGSLLVDTPGGRQEMSAVNEPGMYSLVLKSRKPEAKKFKRWITHDVIPEIRKTGQYAAKPRSVEDLIIMQAESVKELKQKVDHQEKQIKSMKNSLIHTDQDWRDWANKQLNTIGYQMGERYREARRMSYTILENRARCRLDVRLSNLKNRLREAGATETRINDANKLDVIGEDPRLKEIYKSVIEKLSIKYSV